MSGNLDVLGRNELDSGQVAVKLFAHPVIPLGFINLSKIVGNGLVGVIRVGFINALYRYVEHFRVLIILLAGGLGNYFQLWCCQVCQNLLANNSFLTIVHANSECDTVVWRGVCSRKCYWEHPQAKWRAQRKPRGLGGSVVSDWVDPASQSAQSDVVVGGINAET
ncbi:hypothetical protein FIBSPDRAFT_888002 [Athelia psychrophila]|uniref:Uncharacterized protein n=1 Tax=Athelia psychrophila TaxID=1759441 RepID=A0A166NXN0_9AGAM|nr:hypothetical protein FIBSPDRAFT_888002 [Fibularhizoctonia sp. CBS 109695]